MPTFFRSFPEFERVSGGGTQRQPTGRRRVARRGGGRGGGGGGAGAGLTLSASLLQTINGMLREGADVRARAGGRPLATVEDYQGSMVALGMLAQEIGLPSAVVNGLGMVYGVAPPGTAPAGGLGVPESLETLARRTGRPLYGTGGILGTRPPRVAPVRAVPPPPPVTIGMLPPNAFRGIEEGVPLPRPAPPPSFQRRPARTPIRQLPVTGISVGALGRATPGGRYTDLLRRISGRYWMPPYGG